MESHDGLSVAVMLALAAFAVDSLTRGCTFLIFRPGGKELSSAMQEVREWRRKLVYFLIASAITIPLLKMSGIRLLNAMGMSDTKLPWGSEIDAFLTYLVLVGGAERISSFLGMAKGGDDEPSKITGTLTVIPAGEGEKRADAAGRG